MYIKTSFVLRVLGVVAALFSVFIFLTPYIEDSGAVVLLVFLPLQYVCAPVFVSIGFFVIAWMADRSAQQEQQIAIQQKQILQLQQMIKTHAAKPGH